MFWFSLKNFILTDRDLILNTNYALSKAKEEKKILFTTVRKFKGLEADVVIMIDVDGSVFEERMKQKERNSGPLAGERL